MWLPISGIVNAGQGLGMSILARSEQKKHRHPKYPERVLYPRVLAYLCWFVVFLWAVVTAIGWLVFDEASDPGDLAMRWAFYPFGIFAVVALPFFHNSYVESYEDHVIYRTWLRRVHRIDYSNIVAFRIVPGATSPAGIRVWTTAGKRKYFQFPVFGMKEMVEYVTTHNIEERGKRKLPK